MNENDLRDCFAMFAMNGLIHHFDFATFRDDPKRVAVWAYEAADAMLDARKAEPQPEVGIVAVKKRRTK